MFLLSYLSEQAQVSNSRVETRVTGVIDHPR